MKTDPSPEKKTDPSTKQRPVILPDEIASGSYANTYRISGSPNDFLIDFMFSDSEARRVVSRIILHPNKLKSLQRSLSQVMATYEAEHGPLGPSEEK